MLHAHSIFYVNKKILLILFEVGQIAPCGDVLLTVLKMLLLSGFVTMTMLTLCTKSQLLKTTNPKDNPMASFKCKLDEKLEQCSAVACMCV